MTGQMIITPLLAQAASEPAINIPLDDARFLTVLIIIGLPVLLNMINGILSVVKFFKSDPPTHQLYASKGELHEVEHRLEQLIENDSRELKAVEERLTKAQVAAEHRIQNHLSGQDKFQSALQQELKSIHKQLGELNGLLKTRTR